MKSKLYNISFKLITFRHAIMSLSFVLFSFGAFSQVTTEIDSTTIRIGEKISYKIQVETDSTQLVVFPEGQSFFPLEMIESIDVDTIKENAKYSLIKKYGLTQFDSGTYTIPRQKLILGNKIFYTDSLKVQVRDVVVDTTKQGLYGIKPIIEVKKTGSSWWKYVLVVLFSIGVLAVILWWFIWREKPLTEEEKIALLPPYDRAKLALKKLDESHYLEHQQLKDYYSELTLVIRKYLDEKVYDHALESTTDELVSKLQLLKDGNQIDLSSKTIKNIENILRRADLVKFAKSKPDVDLAELDRQTIDAEIDHVKAILPEPKEEEKLLDSKYREAQEQKKKRHKIIATVVISLLLVFTVIAGFSAKYGFDYVKDTVIGHESKELLEGEWVTSQYGIPPVSISTPKVLKRVELPVSDDMKGQVKMTSFVYGTLLDVFSITVNTSAYPNKKGNNIDVEKASEGSVKSFETFGAKDIVVFREKFETPNGAEGLKTYGTLKVPSLTSKELREANYVMLQFASENVLQQIIMTSPKDDVYADQMIARILNSVELKDEEE